MLLSRPPVGIHPCVCICSFSASSEQRRELLKICFDWVFFLCKPLSSPSWYLFTEDLLKLKDRYVFQKIRPPCFPLISCFPRLHPCSFSLVLLLPVSGFLYMTWNSALLCFFEFLFSFGHTMQRRDQQCKEGADSRATQWRSGHHRPKQQAHSFLCHRQKKKKRKKKGNHVGSIPKQKQWVFMN